MSLLVKVKKKWRVASLAFNFFNEHERVLLCSVENIDPF